MQVVEKKINSLTTVVGNLTKRILISNNCASILETTFSGVNNELVQRLVTQKKKKNAGGCPKKLRMFAMTLKIYSAKAIGMCARPFI